METVYIRQLKSTDTELLQKIKLLAAERKYLAVRDFKFNSSIVESAWALLNNEMDPVYFSHAHEIRIDNIDYFRVASRAAQLSKFEHSMNDLGVVGKLRSHHIYTMLFHQLQWCRAAPIRYPPVITANTQYNARSPKSHLVFHLNKSGNFYGVNSEFTIAHINQVEQGVFEVEEKKINEVYDLITKKINVVRI
jgi:hypothetical protein